MKFLGILCGERRGSSDTVVLRLFWKNGPSLNDLARGERDDGTPGTAYYMSCHVFNWKTMDVDRLSARRSDGIRNKLSV